MSTFYITTPIYYVNDVPHLGHAYTTIVADTLARFHRLRGDDTRFLTGTDEHGQKVEEAATKRGLTPRQLVDEVAPRFAEAWRTLGIANDDFIRTTEPRHQRVVAALWQRISAAGDLYLASYDGWYCVGCEQFYTESQLTPRAAEGATAAGFDCPIHKRPVTWVAKERSWFFRLSRFAEPLLAHIAAHPEFIQPDGYRNEIVAFLKSGLRDLSVSRTSFAWGIPVPEADPDGAAHVIYVWLDALTNYYSALCDDGTLDGELVRRYWASATHLIGKDILRFHAVYWPAFLLSAGLPLPRQILAHGWWTVRGEKISKSMPATRIDPLRLADALGRGAPLGRAIGIDAMRYYLLREIPLGNDGDFTFESLLGRYNAELANDLGNLVNRALTLVTTVGFAAGVTPTRHADLAATGVHQALGELAVTVVAEASAALAAALPSRALEAIWRLVGHANSYVGDTAPWVLAKDPARRAELEHVLYTLLAVLRTIAQLVAPVLPTTAETVLTWLDGGTLDPASRRWPSARPLDELVVVRAPAAHQVLYPRLDDKAQALVVSTVVGDDAAVAPAQAQAQVMTAAPAVKPAAAKATKPGAAPAATPEGAITFDDFKRVDLRVGRVLTAVAVPKAKKLLHLSVDLGEAAPRSIVAGIAEAYAPEALVGKQVIVVANLAPAVIRGISSEGMILAAGGEAILGLSALDVDVPPGTQVR
jgi:methionyl-tRNA synthetase